VDPQLTEASLAQTFKPVNLAYLSSTSIHIDVDGGTQDHKKIQVDLLLILKLLVTSSKPAQKDTLSKCDYVRTC